MDNAPGTSHIESLPTEIRQRILVLTGLLVEKGTIGVQTPTWDHGAAFRQPLFTVCHRLRDDALQVFYTRNHFVWHIHRPYNISAKPDSDPSQYPLEMAELKAPTTVTPAVPWLYPRLWKDLRKLSLNVFIPSELDTEAWSMAFPQELQQLVSTVVKCTGLKLLIVTIITGHWRNGKPLPAPYLDIVGVLAQLGVTGEVRVHCKPSTWPVSESIYGLSIEEKIGRDYTFSEVN